MRLSCRDILPKILCVSDKYRHTPPSPEGDPDSLRIVTPDTQKL